MNKGKLIVIEGTDCSGKETQSNKLLENLQKKNIKVFKKSFPMYDTPTGKIVGGPYLGKPSICNGWFKEGANNVPAKVASLYYAADRLYNIADVRNYLNNGYIVILDRYVTSNMAHQGGKLKSKKERLEMFKWIETLEYDLLKLPKPDIKIFLHMPYEFTLKFHLNKAELDEHEKSPENLINAEKTYIELAKIYNFKTIECIKNNEVKTIEDISKEILKYVIEQINN